MIALSRRFSCSRPSSARDSAAACGHATRERDSRRRGLAPRRRHGIICGDVAGVRSPQTQRDSTFLDLDRPAPDQALAVVCSGDRSKFTELFDRLIDRAASGRKARSIVWTGKLQMRVRDVDQFRFIGQPPRLSAFAAGLPTCGATGTTRPEAITTAQPQYTADARRARI
jgi:hypothetical protein